MRAFRTSPPSFLAFLAFLAILLAAACTPTSTSPETDASLAGVRLGMAPRDVRDRFVPDGAGSWATAVVTDPGEDTVLTWTPADGGRVASARFEFHLGMLVAIRERLHRVAAAADPRDALTVTPRTVTSRATTGDEIAITVLARDCPTHHAEAESLAHAGAVSGPRR